MDFIFQWIDLVWVPLALIVVHKGQRMWTVAFLGANMLMMRMMNELMISIGYPYGIMNLLTNDLFTRGLLVYSPFYLFYLLLLYFFPHTTGVFLITTAISIFFAAAFSFALVMVL